MHIIWEVAGWLLMLGWARKLAPVWVSILWPRRLADVPPERGDDAALPGISIIVPARDEAAAIEAALRRMLALDYPQLEVIAVNDRSTDATGTIMDRVAAEDSRCRVVHVSELPAGWLGKNHANALAAKQARGEFLLFTDGDVLFEPDVLRRAMAFMRANGLDHLALLPDPMAETFGEQLLINYFTFQFTLLTNLPRVRDPAARDSFVGIGAFNLVRRSLYEAVGSHERLRMEVADDVLLGKLMKDAGGRQDLLLGAPLVRVKWQKGFTGVIRGLEKNAFAGLRYSVAGVLLVTLISLAVNVLPPILIVTGPARWPAALFAALAMTAHTALARVNGFNPLVGLLYPVAGVVMTYTLLRSMVLALWRGGIRWRDTFYPLAELRAGMLEWRPLGGMLGSGRRSAGR